MNFDKGIPLPPKKTARAIDRHGLALMEVGDSFFVNAAQTTISGVATHWGYKLGRKYATRKVTENGVHGVRVWRVK